MRALLLALLFVATVLVGADEPSAEAAPSLTHEVASTTPALNSPSSSAPPSLLQPFIIHDMSEKEALGMSNSDERIVTPELAPSDPNAPPRGLVPAIVVPNIEDEWTENPNAERTLPVHEPAAAESDSASNMPALDAMKPELPDPATTREDLLMRTEATLKRLDHEYQEVKLHLADLDSIRARLKHVYAAASDQNAEPEAGAGTPDEPLPSESSLADAETDNEPVPPPPPAAEPAHEREKADVAAAVELKSAKQDIASKASLHKLAQKAKADIKAATEALKRHTNKQHESSHHNSHNKKEHIETQREQSPAEKVGLSEINDLLKFSRSHLRQSDKFFERLKKRNAH
jgi:hypothetical protein